MFNVGNEIHFTTKKQNSDIGDQEHMAKQNWDFPKPFNKHHKGNFQFLTFIIQEVMQIIQITVYKVYNIF